MSFVRTSKRSVTGLWNIAANTYQFGACTVKPNENVIVRAGEVHRLEPLAMQVLVHLLSHPDRVVTTDELLDDHWAGRHAEPNMVARRIAQIRKALGDDAKAPSFIETIPKRGYRVVAPIESSQVRGGEYVIAVLPFLEIGSTDTLIGDAIAEDIINALVRSANVRVIARTSSFQFKAKTDDVRAIGKALNATHVVEGSVRIVADQMRITAQLVSSDDGEHLWSEQFDFATQDLFEVQDHIAQTVLTTFNLLFTPRKRLPTTNPAALTAFLEARRLSTVSNDLDGGVSALKRAITLDPDYADAHAMIASFNHGKVNWKSNSIPEMKKITPPHIAAALRADPTNPLARATLATEKFFVERELQEGIDLYAAVAREVPNDIFVLFPFATMLRAVDHTAATLNLDRRCIALDPLNPMLRWRIAEDLLWAGYYEESIEQAEQAEKMGIPAANLRAQAALIMGDMAYVEKTLEGPGWFPEERRLLFAAELAADQGERGELEALLESMKRQAAGSENKLGPYSVRSLAASVALIEGDLEPAIVWFERSITDWFHGIWYCLAGPCRTDQPHGVNLDRQRYPELYADPRLEKILRRYGVDRDSIIRVELPDLPF